MKIREKLECNPEAKAQAGSTEDTGGLFSLSITDTSFQVTLVAGSVLRSLDV